MKGLGTVLLQEGIPVIYVSTTLTPAEERYSNIERTFRSSVRHGEASQLFMVGQFEFKPITNHWRRFGKRALLQQSQDFKGYFRDLQGTRSS